MVTKINNIKKLSAKNRKDSGVTLITLAVTIVVLLILASIATYSGISVINSSKLTKFTTEMKMMQAQVNGLYDKYKNNEKVTIGTNEYAVEELGRDISEVTAQVNKVFNSSASGITDTTGYRYFDTQTLKDLNIEKIEQEFFVNVSTRSVISYDGIKYEGKMYYTLEQLPNSVYNVNYEGNTSSVPKINSSKLEQIADDKWRITISDIEYDGYIEKWEVKYQLEGTDYWSTSEDLSFIVTKVGKYLVKVQNGAIESEVIEIDMRME